MASRLGFAVATCRRPDVLLIDEVLAVGDAAFQEKCLERLESFRSLGTAILFVSHNPEIIKRLCSRAAWLSAGRIEREGPASAVVDAYLAFEARKPSDGAVEMAWGVTESERLELLGRSGA